MATENSSIPSLDNRCRTRTICGHQNSRRKTKYRGALGHGPPVLPNSRGQDIQSVQSYWWGRCTSPICSPRSTRAFFAAPSEHGTTSPQSRMWLLHLHWHGVLSPLLSLNAFTRHLRKFSEHPALPVFQQVFLGMELMQGKEVRHHDLISHSVLMAADCNIKIAGFFHFQHKM